MAANPSTILITGATGQVGRRVLSRLKQDPALRMVAATRSPEKAGNLGVEVVALDLDRIETMAPALAGVERVFLMTGYTVDMPRQSKVFIDEAKRAGVQQIVHLGACGDDEATVAHWAWHQLVERYIEWAGFTYTHLRPEWFMQNLLGYGGKSPIVQGAITNYAGSARISWVDCDDVSAVAAICLQNPAAHAGQTYRLGYDAKSYEEIARVLTGTVGQPFFAQSHSPEEFLSNVLAAGADPAYMKCVRDHYYAYQKGEIPSADAVFDNFETITGKKPTLWKDFAAQHAAAFRY